MSAPPAYQRFEFTGVSTAGHQLHLDYRLAGGPAPDLAFREILGLPASLPAPDPDDPVTRALLAGVHRVFGVSYFKACIPPQIVAEPLPADDAAFWDLLYGEGMGEFWYTNGLDPRGRVHFPRGEAGPAPAVAPAARGGAERVLVLSGGGKDSAVAFEVVRHAGVAADALTLGDSAPQRAQIAAMGVGQLVVTRRLDPALLELNRQGALNGHVPISACIAFIAVLVAHLGGYSAVIAANERSADEGNLVWQGLRINHQWSKSLAFEAAFQDWCRRNIPGGPLYFSLLRPLGELRIAAAIAAHPRYFESFTSCNRNFRVDPQGPVARWCGHCPKCVFTNLILAPFLAPDALLGILGGDFLADPANLDLIAALTGIDGDKPFDCVGTGAEARAALVRLADDARLPAGLADWFARHGERLRVGAAAAWDEAMTVGGPHRLSAPWGRRLCAYLGLSDDCLGAPP